MSDFRFSTGSTVTHSRSVGGENDTAKDTRAISGKTISKHEGRKPEAKKPGLFRKDEIKRKKDVFIK